MTLQEAFDVLFRRCGNQRKAAKYLGISEVHYRRVRNQIKPPTRLEDYIILKAQALEKDGIPCEKPI